jgi:hypothetical protein
MESRRMLSGLALAPAMHGAHASAAEINRVVATPLVHSRDTVQIRNNTSFHVHVIARLLVHGSIKPTISHQIGPNGSVAVFSFGRHAQDFIAIEVRRVGGTTPPPFALTLNMPLGGYHGKLFTVSVFGDRFNVSG